MLKTVTTLVVGAVVCGSAFATPKDTLNFRAPEAGVKFRCAPEQLRQAEKGMDAYLVKQGIKAEWFQKIKRDSQSLTYTLKTPAGDTDTLTLIQRPEFELREELLQLPTLDGKPRTVKTVSQQEIILALMQHGRLTEFAGPACDAQAFIDHVGIRQLTVAWAEQLEWGWPDGTPASWNPVHWTPDSPAPLTQVREAINDTFMQQPLYAIGCYTATKLVMAQGILDYYARISPNPARVKEIEARMMLDNAPLRNVEPGVMWNFEADYDAADDQIEGKLLQMQRGVASRNFVPGDWAYFFNTDVESYAKVGYEGSNAIYLGRGLFDDYYRDHNYRYTYREKMHEVYQWRNQVFSRTRDAHLVKPLSEKDFMRLEQSPEQGGILLTLRTYPYFFGYQTLPSYVPPAPKAAN